MGKKGISPLIATVMLIAFTMAIAGIMATWATRFVQEQITTAENTTSSSCSGSILVDASIIGGKGYAIVTVETATRSLSDWKGYVYYADPSKNEEVILSNSTKYMSPGDTFTFNFTNSSANPSKLRIAAGNCISASKTVDIAKS